MVLIKNIILWLCLLSAPVLAQQSDSDLNYEKGKYYALKYQYDLAKPWLKKAADDGNENAMLRYAFLVNVQHGLFLNPEAFEYVEKSASKGNEWAMSLLADYKYSGVTKTESAKWRKILDAKLAPYLDKNDKDALYFMSHLEFVDNQEKWLDKSAEAGSSKAMRELASYYQSGNGWFLLPDSREKKIASLLDSAYKLGDRVVIYSHGLILIKNGDIEQGEVEWNKLIELGDGELIQNIIINYLDNKHFSQIYNLEKAARLMKVYLESMGTDGNVNAYSAFKEQYPEIYSSLTPEQQANVDKWVKDYLSTHDVLAPDPMWETKFK
jgi:uncharacterized protein